MGASATSDAVGSEAGTSAASAVAGRPPLDQIPALHVRSVVLRLVLLLGACASSGSAGPLVLTPKGGKGSGLAGSIWIGGVLLVLAAGSPMILLASASIVSPPHTLLLGAIYRCGVSAAAP